MKKDSPRRGRKPLHARERKDRIVQTRVPGELEDALREAAEQQHVSVSQLIRNLLEDSFHLVDNIVADSAGLVDSITRDARKLASTARDRAHAVRTQSTPAPAEPIVDAWQAVVLNRGVTCHFCSRSLAGGTHAWQACGTQLTQTIWCCERCLPRPADN